GPDLHLSGRLRTVRDYLRGPRRAVVRQAVCLGDARQQGLRVDNDECRSAGAVDMMGAIAGDVIGSIYESVPVKSTAFPLFAEGCRFTDDTVLTVATAWAILRRESFEAAYLEFGRRYPHAGYGARFRDWLRM